MWSRGFLLVGTALIGAVVPWSSLATAVAASEEDDSAACAAAGAAGGEGCDHAALLQARIASSSSFLQGRADPAPQAAAWLGFGHDVAREDYWGMTGLTSKVIFNPLPDECFQEASCPAGISSTSKFFSSVSQWAGYYADQFGIKVSGGYGGFSASVDASMSSKSTYAGDWSKSIQFTATQNVQECYRLRMTQKCAYNKTNLVKTFLDRLDLLPKGAPYTSENMEAWVAGFIERFGTHMVTMSQHGAAFKTLASAEYRDTQSKSCMSQGMCLSFEAMEYASLSLCANSSGCDARNQSEHFESASCKAVGGNPQLVPRMCSSEVSKAKYDNWIVGGDITDGASAYQYTFKALSDYLPSIDFNYYLDGTSKTLAKAVDYHNCRTGLNPPVEEWDEDEGCKCVRPCENGGEIDVATCTCKCRGDIFHGWKGTNCQETYGECQPGPGSGNPAAANRCRTGGLCASSFESDKCGVTELCCATNFGVTCCPFGNYCKCTADHCTCMVDNTTDSKAASGQLLH